MLPLSQYRHSATAVACLNLAVTTMLSAMSDAPWWTAWLCWAVSLGLAAGIDNIIGRYALVQRRGATTVVVIWTILTATLNYVAHYLPQQTTPLWFSLTDAVVTLLIIGIVMGTWQRTFAPVEMLATGALLGTMSVYMPDMLYRLLLVPIALYQMRSLSLRNVAATLTGTALAVWTAYCLTFALAGEASADAIIGHYASISDFSPSALPSMGLQMWAFVGLYLLLMAVYSFTSFIAGAGNTLRSHSAIILVATLGIIMAVFAVFDIDDLSLYLVLLSELLALQIALHKTERPSQVAEWWTVSFIATLLAMDVLPIAFKFI